MAEIFRSRDCVVFFKGDSSTVAVDANMIAGGWPGGQGVQWTGSTVDTRIVTYSNGYYGGTLVWGSKEAGDDYASITEQQPYYQYATILFGGNLLATSTYERYTYQSRISGPLVPITYHINDPLYFSLRGYFTNQDELTLSGNLLAPAFFVGFVAQVPKSNNNYWIGVQTSM